MYWDMYWSVDLIVSDPDESSLVDVSDVSSTIILAVAVCLTPSIEYFVTFSDTFKFAKRS